MYGHFPNNTLYLFYFEFSLDYLTEQYVEMGSRNQENSVTVG